MQEEPPLFACPGQGLDPGSPALDPDLAEFLEGLELVHEGGDSLEVGVGVGVVEVGLAHLKGVADHSNSCMISGMCCVFYCFETLSFPYSLADVFAVCLNNIG